jgi:prepilin-type N-terminal cleavage/methylation domain-containing protein
MRPANRNGRRAVRRGRSARGFTLLELVLALAIAALLFGALAGLTGESLRALALVREHETLNEDARFAMERMVTAVRGTSRLLLPLAENPATPHSEAVRDVLAVALPPSVDRDQDGVADADNDGDGLVDEDPGVDLTDDDANGIVGIDDDGDGAVDEGGTGPMGNFADDDEDGSFNEDAWDGADDDDDGSVGEDPEGDWNGDDEAGVAGVDDDADGSTDEGARTDDDEDGDANEDPFDPVVFFLSGTTLVERLPNLDPADGLDFSERPIAENVGDFRVERLAPGVNDRAVLVDITLQLATASGETVDVTTRVRVGGGE